MRSKIIALGACLLIGGVALAQHKTYTVRQGDNISDLAIKFKVRRVEIIQANDLKDAGKLKLGMKLKIPTKDQPKAEKKVAKATKASTPVASTKIATKTAIVAKADCIIRRAPSTTADKVTTVDAGTKVAVLESKNGWYKLRFPKGTVGWMRSDLLKAAPATSKKASTVVAKKAAPAKQQVVVKNTPAPAKEQIVTALPVSVTTSAKASVATKVVKPTEVKKTAPKKVAPKKSTSRQPADIVSMDSSDLLDKAYSYRGTRYRYGGTSRGGFDCSGFVGHVFKTQGVKLPRTSRSMSRVGRSVSKKNLAPGDLVFFATRGRGVGHVGIYAGNGRFIHSSSSRSGGVKVSSLSEKYYAKRFAGAKRVVKGGASNAAPKKAAAADPSKAPIITVHRAPSPAIEEKPKDPTIGSVRTVTDEIGNN